MKNIIFLILSIFIFTACSNKNEVVQNSKENKQMQVQSNLNEGDFDDEFGDEFAQEEEKKEVFDPLSGYNRAMTKFNDFVFLNAINPIAKGYAYVTPEPLRVGLSNAFDNLMFPVRFVNNILQLKFANASEEFGRFVINSIWGLGGFMDPAKEHLGWEEHNEDFGQTLGYYGVGGGFHIVLPILGPSNLRDTLSLSANNYISPLSDFGSKDIAYKIPKNGMESLGISAVQNINTLSLNLGQYESIKKDALDLYPFLRDVYEQKRKKDIKE